MNPKRLVTAAIVLAFTLLQAHGQSPAPVQSPPATAAHLGEVIINVLGQVNQQARVTLPAGSALLDAIAAAGGFTKIANPADVMLIHRSNGKKPDSVKINMKPIVSGKVKDIKLRDGDTVIVGEAIF